jgi:DNA-binding NarL/FixJ family response regulator
MNISVYLADDHAIVRDGLRLLLEAENDIDVIGSAADGRSAVREIRKLNPNIVILDIAMPLLNGIEATLQILESCPSTKVIILSMHATREHIHRAMHAGARGYLLKESAGSEVVKAIRTVYAGNRHLSQKVSETILDDYLNQGGNDPKDSPIKLLSVREREILQLVVEGQSNSQIAENLCLSPKTVETYRSRVMQKLQIKNLPALVKFAIRAGITSLDY